MGRTTSPGRVFIDRGGSQSDLRRYNERIVLSALDRHPGLFNAELARRTGLAAQTISVILRTLHAQGLIARGAVLRGRRGQPATPVFLKPDGAYAIGAALCWRSLSVCLSDFSGAVVRHDYIRHPFPDFDRLIATLAGRVADFLAGLPQAARGRVAGLGVALPGAMDRYAAILGADPALSRAWAARDFCAELSDAIGLPVWQTGYGAAASAAEAERGDGAPENDFAYFFVGTLLMGGMAESGRSFSGAGAAPPLYGAMIVPGSDGASVAADSIVSVHGLEAALADAGGAGDVDAHWAWQSGSECVERWLDAAALALGHVVFNARCVTGFNTVVIDSLLPPDLVSGLVARTQAALATLPGGVRLPEIVQGRLGSRAAMIGAARLVFRQCFFNTDPAA